MFGSFPGLANAPKSRIDPKDIPPPTSVALPRYQPFAQGGDGPEQWDALAELLKYNGRTNAVLGPRGISAIGFDLSLDAQAQDILPDASIVPEFETWDFLSAEDARELNASTSHPLRHGKQSPGCQVYLERRRELSNNNADGFRTVRRLPPPKGKQQARLGNAYEFFRCLELFTTFWDDPTKPLELPPDPEMLPSDGDSSAGESKELGPEQEDERFGRTAAGSSMPTEYRLNLISAFVKLVSYDFGCNVARSLKEPRLQMCSPRDSPSPRKTYCPSACSFIFQSPTTREAARAGIVSGPVAAVSARPTTDFVTPDIESAQSLDLAREIVAALITRQHRDREGQTEARFGQDQWWTSKPRWGGGCGGPIGREIDKYAVQGDGDARPEDSDGMPAPVAKKPRKNMSIYDSYRMVRPPAATWDKKARYEAIGKQKSGGGGGYDDVFVISSLFHHVSVMRVRVPDGLMEALDGRQPRPGSSEGGLSAGGGGWGKVPAWRSPWYDLFDVDQRIAAMQLLWSVMLYQMRTDPGDVEMKDTE